MGTELKNTIPFTITPQKMKYSGVNVKLATYERKPKYKQMERQNLLIDQKPQHMKRWLLTVPGIRLKQAS